ncbi:MAG: M15 family metallopeptidase [Oscillospiraceae bacterium]|nr:M15 family metallopeptidase [Ruminococcus sp.]MCD8345893.1 M15 family metallopeptidase [Oscillospiraceae bacterium]
MKKGKRIDYLSFKKKASRIRYGNLALILAILLIIIAIICVSCSAVRKSDDSEKSDSEQQGETTTNLSDYVEEEPDASTTSDPTQQSSYLFASVTVSSDEIGSGTLVLVNNNIALLNEVNEDDLVVVREYKNSAYWVSDYSVKILPDAMDALNEMLLGFYTATGNDNVMVRSGYRSFDYQQELYEEELASTGEDSSTLVAKAGYSEHHTGYAIDFTTYNGSSYSDFDGEGDYEWIMENCYKYGYINRYPEGKESITLIDNEPWHFRYVGIPHAQVMYEYDMCLEEYISFIKNYTIDSGFLLVNADDGAQYIIYYVPMSSSDSTTIYVPLQDDGVTAYPYEISGNNVDGFIVTVTLKAGTGVASSSTTTEDETTEGEAESAEGTESESAE